MKKLVQIHDECLEREIEIEDEVAELGEIRVKAYKSRDPELVKTMILVLNAIIQTAENYKEYLMEPEE